MKRPTEEQKHLYQMQREGARRVNRLFTAIKGIKNKQQRQAVSDALVSYSLWLLDIGR